MKKAYFQYYETFEKIVEKFDTAEEREIFRKKIIEYGLYGTEPEELTERESFVWDLVKDMIDDQVHRREVNKANRAKRDQAIQIPIGDLPPDRDETQQDNKTKRFVKPAVEEVQEYCTSRNNGINAQQFVDYYEARGWKIGNNSMKDWKAAVRTWEQRRQNEGTYSPKQGYEWPEDKLTL